jgi:DNA-directed RNA polymerase specialized sigma24 family protein
MEELTFEEIAERLGVSLATAKRWVARAARQVSVLVEADPELSARLGERGGFHARG